MPDYMFCGRKCEKEATLIICRRMGTCSRAKADWATLSRVKPDGKFASWASTLTRCQHSDLATGLVGERSSLATRFLFRQHHPCAWSLSWLPKMAPFIHCSVGPVGAGGPLNGRGTSGHSIPCHRS